MSGQSNENSAVAAMESGTAARSCVMHSLNEPRRELAERLDGSYVLKSDRTDLGAEEAWRIYHLLTRAENAFRCMKSPLAERPIFHQVQRRVATPIFLRVLDRRRCGAFPRFSPSLRGAG